MCSSIVKSFLLFLFSRRFIFINLVPYMLKNINYHILLHNVTKLKCPSLSLGVHTLRSTGGWPMPGMLRRPLVCQFLKLLFFFMLSY